MKIRQTVSKFPFKRNNRIISFRWCLPKKNNIFLNKSMYVLFTKNFVKLQVCEELNPSENKIFLWGKDTCTCTL